MNRSILIFDGGMGSLLSLYGIKSAAPDLLNIENPNVILNIHIEYLKAGANILTTNTFGASSMVLKDHGLENDVQRINIAACRIARQAFEKSKIVDRPIFIAGEIGPTSKLPTFGHITYDEMKASYREQADALIEGGVDFTIIETSQDPLQIKAAINAVNSRLPVMVSLTTDKNDRMLVGSTVESTLAAIEPYTPIAFGLNCSTGPDGMTDKLFFLKNSSPFPIICRPNAGLPQMNQGKPIYPLSPQEFGEWMERFVNEFDVRLPGGCCGTTPDHISHLAARIKKRNKKFNAKFFRPSVSSLFTSYPLNQNPPPFLIAEQTSAAGSKKFRDMLAKDDFEGMNQTARLSSKASHALDINLSAAQRNELDDYKKFLKNLILSADNAIMVDSRNPDAMRCALSMIPGRSIINSINLENIDETKQILKIAFEFRAAVVALTIDEDGMAKTALKKTKIAARLINLAGQYGIRERDLIIDPLTFTLGSGDQSSRDSANETIRAITSIKKDFPEVGILMGVSNASYGLPNKIRNSLNSILLYKAIENGLTAAIINPSKILPLDSIPQLEKVWCERLIENNMTNGDPIIKLIGLSEKKLEEKQTFKKISLEERLVEMIIDGNSHEIEKILKELLQKHSPTDLINNFMLSAMKEVGLRFSNGEMPLPFVLNSAQTMKRASEIIFPHLNSSSQGKKGTLILATVRGDVHDIGKDLVDIVISNNGFRVVNLGIRQPVNAIIDAAEKHNADAIGLSGLLISSIEVMKEYLDILKQRGFSKPVLVGGAVLSQKITDSMLVPTYGEVYYCKDAFAGLNVMEKIVIRNL